FGEYHIGYSERIGETKLFPWTDGVDNLLFLIKYRLRGTQLEKLVARRSRAQRRASGSGTKAG
ncbi:MAG TPA: hypothetical protein VM409_08600, partial [Chloroflexia bacterium]|nr:hypothetical protein [Chloroflexia bacterium]